MADDQDTRTDYAVAGAASADEARLFHDIVGKIRRLPAGVHRVGFRFGEDSTGSPAVWIRFVADDDLKPSKDKIADFLSILDEVRDQVLRSDSDRWPYFEIVTE